VDPPEPPRLPEQLLAEAVARALSLHGCDCLLLSGGIDTAFTALAARLHGHRLDHAILVGGQDCPDTPYAIYTASRLGLPLDIADPRASPTAYWHAVEAAALWLETIDPVEVASGAALLIGLHHAKSLGCRCVATGDGGDELFLGYSFLHHAPEHRLQAWRRRMEGGGARFQAPTLSRLAGVPVALPLYTPEARTIASSQPTHTLITPLTRGAPPGKTPLRRLLYHAGLERVALRRKTPITHGSCTLRILEEEARGKPKARHPWLPTPLHAALQHIHDKAGTGLPKPCRDPESRCPICGSCMRNNHCPYCGAYKHPDGKITIHSLS